MKKRIELLNFYTPALMVSVLVNAGTLAFAELRNMVASARATAIHDCNVEANRFSPITQLNNQFAVYGTCMASHGQSLE
jgi:hypothetical protein